jgi:hypothetical protein
VDWQKTLNFAPENLRMVAGVKERDMSKRVRITNEILNSYGTRVLTSGMSIEQYCRNPVLLYMHERGNVIGYVKDVKVEDDSVTGELVFDEASELSKRCKKQWEFGSLKMVSAGLDILELSEAKELLVEGQTRPTISKSKLFEVSLVDIGANDDAIRLHKDGIAIELGKDGTCVLPLLNKTINEKDMDLKQIALQLGLPETADEAAVNAKLVELKKAEGEVKTLQSEKAKLELGSITTLVETAIGEKKIGADRKEQFINLGKTIGIDELKKTFDAMAPQVRLSQVITPGATPSGAKTYTKLSEVPSDELLAMRENNKAEYKRLYKAEYGYECEI